MASAHAIYSAVAATDRLYQGEILRNVVERLVKRVGDDFAAEDLIHPYAVVLTQDCDLEQDHNARAPNAEGKGKDAGRIPRVLLIEAFAADAYKTKLGGSDIAKRARQNKDERYHYLAAVPAEADLQRQGIPALYLDFKRYMTLDLEEFRADMASGVTQRCSRLTTPYAEHLSSRFGYFLLRIGLPLDHHRAEEVGPPMAPAATPPSSTVTTVSSPTGGATSPGGDGGRAEAAPRIDTETPGLPK